jgi:hypothetical protein
MSELNVPDCETNIININILYFRMESDGNNMKKQRPIKKSDGKYNLLFYLLQFHQTLENSFNVYMYIIN